MLEESLNFTNMKLIKTILYEEVDFKFISNHWDVHLNGTCIFNNELCEFKNITEEPSYNEKEDEWEPVFCEIYKLNWFEKLKWRYRQWVFEKCVGKHWSYPQRKNGVRFTGSNPKLFKWYYKLKKHFKQD